MAVGKSTLGRALAAHHGLPFVDLDEQIAEAAGRGVAELFAVEGEAAFRARERAALEGALEAPRFVLALGGGALHSPGVPARVQARARLLMLWAPFAELEPRLGDRPLRAEAEARYWARAPAEAAWGERVDLTGLSPGEALLALLRQLGAPPAERSS